MKNLKKLILPLVVLLCISSNAGAQVLDAPPRDNFYDKIWIEQKTPVELPYVREVEVNWAKTVWKTIDLREKINQPLYYPVEPIQNRRSLMQVIYDGIREGSIIAYQDDEFTQPLTAETVQERLEQTEFWTDEEGVLQEEVIDFRPSDVTQFRIKEVWFIDSKRSVLDVRILGLCPVRFSQREDGTMEREPLFWVHYPHVRNILVNAEVFNRHNDAQRVSFDDMFLRRMFNGFIIKESNVYDRFIAEYFQGIDALLEADKVRSEIRNMELDLWEY